MAVMERLSVERLRADEKLIESVRRFPCLWEIRSKAFRDLAAKEAAWKVVAQEVGYSDEDCLKRWKSLRDRFVREAKKMKENTTLEGAAGYIPPWSLFPSMSFLMDSIRHRRSSMLTLKRDAAALLSLPEDSADLETSGDGDYIPLGSPGGSSVELNNDTSHPQASKRRKSTRLLGQFGMAPPSSSDQHLKKDVSSGSGPNQAVSQAILKSLKTLEETVQEQQRVIEDEDELFGKQVAMVMRRLTCKQKAMAKLKIQQVFLDVEFPSDGAEMSN